MAILIKSFVFTLIFSFGFYLTYNQVYNDFPSDITAHINIAAKIVDGFGIRTPYPLWHILVSGVSVLFELDVRDGAVVVTAMTIVSLAIVIFSILKCSLKNESLEISHDKKDYLLLSATIIIMVMTAVYVPFFNKFVILGQPSCGVWHNVTLLTVKPIAFLSFFYMVQYFETKSIKSLLVASSMTLLSIYAKPSYVVAFLPAVFIFFPMFIMRQTGCNIIQLFSDFVGMATRFKRELLFLSLITIFSSMLLFGQFNVLYTGDTSNAGQESSKVIFDFLGVWSLFTPSVAGSLLLSYLFPLSVQFLVKGKKSNAYLLALIMSIVSILLLALFAEEGPRYEHGNFGWSQLLSIQLLFIFSIVEYIKKYAQLKEWKKYLLSVALSLHIISGAFYLIKISSGLFYG